MKSVFKAMRKGIYAFLLLFLLPLALGDGVAISLKDFHRWSLVDETSQVAFINHQKGIEKLIISITTKESERNIYWLFPIPSAPEKVNLQILYGLPNFAGEEVKAQALENLESSTTYLYLNQIYTLPFLLFFAAKGKIGQQSLYMGPPVLGKGPEVTVYEHIEKGGAVAEKVTAKDANSLYDYLKSKGLHITKGAIPVLDYYIGKDYTFIITWLKSSFYFVKEKARAIYVKFPSPKIYYPLYPTSIYGRKEIPISIYITRFNSVHLFPKIKDYASIEYLIGEYYESVSLGENQIPPMKEFLEEAKKSGECTKISIDAPASAFTSDLWITPYPAPPRVRYAKFIAKHPSFTSLLILIIASCLSSYLMGLILFPFLRKEPFPLLALGFANVFTLLAVIILVASLQTKEERKDVKETIEILRKKEYVAKRYISVILFALASIFAAVFVALLSSALSEISYTHPDLSNTIFFGLLSIGALWGGIALSRVYEEDRKFFNELKEAGYSTWFFCPVDRAKLVFVFLFSLSYLFLVWFLRTLLSLPLRFG